jgi:tetratricopeptide (TPR) repeat protein
VVPQSLDDVSLQRLNADIERARVLINRRSYTEATALLRAAIEIAPRHALAHFLLGRILMAEEAWDDAWRHLDTAIAEDGFPHRAVPTINARARVVAKHSDGAVIFIEHVNRLRHLISNGMAPRQLMADWVHPSFLNHALIAAEVICTLKGIEQFMDRLQQAPCALPADKVEAEAMRERLRRSMNVTPVEIASAKSAIYRWAVLLSRLTSTPEAFYTFAAQTVDSFYYENRNAPRTRARVAALEAYFDALRGATCEKVRRGLKSASEIDVGGLRETLADPFSFPTRGFDIVATLSESGIKLSTNDTEIAWAESCQ